MSNNNKLDMTKSGRFYIMHNGGGHAIDGDWSGDDEGKRRGIYTKDPLLNIQKRGVVGHLLLPWSKNTNNPIEYAKHVQQLRMDKRGGRHIAHELQPGDIVMIRSFSYEQAPKGDTKKKIPLNERKCCLVQVIGQKPKHGDLFRDYGWTRSCWKESLQWEYAQFLEVRVLITASELSSFHQNLTPKCCRGTCIKNNKFKLINYNDKLSYEIESLSPTEWESWDGTELINTLLGQNKNNE